MNAILHGFKHTSTTNETSLHLLLFYQLLILKYRNHYNTLLEKKLIKIKGKRFFLTSKKDKKDTINCGSRKSQAVTLLSVLF